VTTSTSNLSQRLPGRRAFITGAASGLGLACAEILAREGWQLVLTDVDAPALIRWPPVSFVTARGLPP